MRKIVLFSGFALFILRSAAQVNVSTGSAVFNVPIQSWHDTKSRLGASVALQYNSKAGLKVDEVASNIGQGWNLSGGGAIVRMQVGQPDDQKPKDGAYSDITKYPPGYLYNPASIATGCPAALRFYPIFGSQNTLYKNDNVTDADREQDYFAFTFNGRNGIFVLGKMTSGTGGNAIFLGDSKLKAWYDIDEASAASQHLRTTISAFHIQDENGLIYTFRDKGLTKVLKVHSANLTTDGYGDPVPMQTGAPSSYNAWAVYYESAFDELEDADNPYVVGSWYLSEVKDPLTGRAIEYSYHVESMYNYAGTDIRAVSRPYVIVSLNYSYTKTPVLDLVTYPDGTTTTYMYGPNRIDMPGDKQLTNIQVSYQGRQSYRFDFNQSYMVKNQVRQPTDMSEWLFSRLCLLSVKKWGADGNGQETVCSFTYNTGTDGTENCVPPQFSQVRDIWGFYNGNQHTGHDNNGVVVTPSPFTPVAGRTFYEYEVLSYVYANINPKTNPDPNVKPGYAALGLLQTVTYPGGGTLTYSYAQNTGLFPGDAEESNCGGVHVSQTVVHDGSSSTAADVVTHYSYTMSDATSSIWGLEKAINLRVSTSNYEAEGRHPTLDGCDYDYKYPGILSLDQATSVSDMQQAMAILSKIMGYAGLGLDISQIYIAATTTGGNPVFAIIELVWDVLTNFIASCDQYTITNTDMLYFNRDLNSSNPLPIQFKRAVTTVGDGSNGQTVYEFTSPDVPGIPAILVPDNSASFSQRQRSLSWVYGLPKMVTVLDASGNPVKQTETDYDFSAATTQRVIDDGTGGATQGSCTCSPINTYSMESDNWTSSGFINAMEPSNSTDVAIQPYVLYTGRTPVTDVYQRSFKDVNNKLETHVHYDYSPNNFLPRKVTTTLSNGDQSIREMYYGADYSQTGVFQTMAANNLVDLPVATYHSVIKNQICNDCPPNQPVYLGASVNNYSVQPDGDIKPQTTYTSWSEVVNQLGGGSNFAFDGTNPTNYPNLVTTQTFEYDAVTGNLVRKSDEGGRVMTNLYDYGDQFLVARVTNADPDVDKSAYTSFETSSTGLWAVSGGSGWQSTNAITGTSGFNLGGRSLTVSFSIGKPYILSFWAYSGAQVSVGGSVVLKKTGPTNNNFTYYEYSIAAGSAAPTVSGTGIIDELRLYPANARMTTYTYDPVLGKTSECDDNNRIIYYEYDPTGRLHIIRDEQMNVVKMYEYNYKQ